MISAIENRRSNRKFQPDKPVSKDQLKQLLQAAMLAPSARNTRPWEFIAVTNRKVLDEFASILTYAKMCASATAAIVVVGIPQPDMPEGYFAQCCSAATQNILLQAADIGLGTCWCGIYPREERIEPISKLLGITGPKVPFNVIAIGAPDDAPAQKGFYEESKVSFLE